MNLHGWLPARITWRDNRPRVEWTLMGTRRLTEPFFEQTLRSHMTHPFHQLLRPDTSIEEMLEWSNSLPRVPLRGIIFHLSRCGSTLLSQQIAALECNIVASEPAPFNSLLLAHHRMPNLVRYVHIQWLRAMAHSLGHARSGEQAFYLKTDCWHIHEIDLIRDAFPQAPWIFLYRDPVDVMVSHQRVPAAWTVPQLLNPRALKLEADDWDPRQTEVYCARALALMCEAALKAARGDERALLLNYSELPHATCDRVLAHFGLPAAGILEMQARAGQDAKAPQSRFAPDHESKQAAATQRLRNTVTLHLADVYRRLEQARLAQSTAPSAGIPEPNIRSEQASVNCERVTHLTSVECKLATRVRRLTLEGEIISD